MIGKEKGRIYEGKERQVLGKGERFGKTGSGEGYGEGLGKSDWHWGRILKGLGKRDR